MNKKVCSFPILFALLALLIGTCAAVFPASAQAVPTSTGSITVSGTVARSYDAYQIFSANVVDGDSDAKIATDLAWASDAVRDAALPVLHSAGMSNSQTTAQEAAEWLNADFHLTSALSAQLARSLQSSDAVPLNAGTASELPCGYWLIVADDDSISQGEAGTAPVMALVGGSAVTVKPKAATPKVVKHVLEDSTAAWQKAADATVADDLYWRLSATVPAGLTAYDTYTVQFVDTMSAGLDPSKVAASMRVYAAAGADGGFDAVSTGKDGRVGTEPAKGWTDITAQCATKVAADGKTFTVRTGDLIAALGGADAFTAGARVVAVYDAPLGASCNRGATKGNPNEVCLRYPRSPLADQSGDAGFTRTPSDDACAYTWGLSLIKRSSSDDKPLAGAKLRIIDDRGRILTTDGSWSTDADACITTDADGHVELSGVDAGVYTVEEIAAPKGYTAFEGKRTVTVTAEGLDVKQVATAKPKVTVSVENPLRVDTADARTGSIEPSVLNTPSKEAGRGFMPSTGDRTLVLVAVLAAIGVAAIVVALVIKRGGGRREK